VYAAISLNLPGAMSGSIRLFVRDRLERDAAVSLPPGQARYVLTVMRCRLGDAVRLFNGMDGEWRAVIIQAGRAQATVLAQEKLREQAPDGADISLAFALLKRDATDLVVQKATELGATAIQPVITVRTNAARVNLQRLCAIATEAAEQSERLAIPEVRAPVSLKGLLDTWPNDRMLFTAMERTDSPRLRPLNDSAGLLVGPEGGWTEEERRLILSHTFARPVSLGGLVLRAETACLAGLVLLQAGARD
jgi:16S rRNA (uracil1498-N3)-methyltransferase